MDAFTKLKQSWQISIIILLSICLLTCCTKHKKETISKPPPVLVKMAEATKADAPYYVEGIGHLVPFNTIDISPLVTGMIFTVNFNEGDFVKKGQLLYTIDPRPYEAALLEALGTLAMDQANLVLAQIKVERYTELFKKDYYAAVNYDELVQNVKFYEGSIQRDQGNIAAARLNIEYCQIKAPVDGFISIRLVDIGNIAVPGGTQTLATLVQSSPIYADFTIPERELNDIRKYLSISPLKVDVFFQNDIDPSMSGVLTVVNNQSEVGTGMVRLKALLHNENYIGWPQQYIWARILVKFLHDSVVIPESAIQIGQGGEYVYIIKPDMIVENRFITKGIKFGTDQYVIEKGVEFGEKVVTDGQLNLTPGAAVTFAKQESEKETE